MLKTTLLGNDVVTEYNDKSKVENVAMLIHMSDDASRPSNCVECLDIYIYFIISWTVIKTLFTTKM